MGEAGGGIGLAERTEEEAEGVAQLAVDLFSEAFEEWLAGDDVLTEVDAGDPEADDVAAEGVHDGDWVDEVAEGLGERAAFFVERPAEGGDGLEGGAVVHADGAEQRGHEPAAMLVAALGVEVGAGIGVVGLLLDIGVEVDDGVGAGAGVEPDVEHVHLLAEVGVAADAGGSGGEDFFRRADEPGVGGLAHEEGDDGFIDFGRAKGLSALAAEEDGDGDAPHLLAGDAPVGAGEDHVGDALLSPGGVPCDGLDLVDGALAEGGVGAVGGGHLRIHLDEPLLGGAGDDRFVAAPAVGVGVLHVGDGEERAAFFEQLDDDGVGLEDGEAFVGLGLASAEALGADLAAGVVYILDFGEVVTLAGGEVVDAVGGGGVDGSGAGVVGDVGGVGAENRAVEEGMLEGGAVERGTGEAGDLACIGEVAGSDDFSGEGGGDDISGFGRGEGHVLEVGMEGDGEGGGKGPGGGGPDDGEDGILWRIPHLSAQVRARRWGTRHGGRWGIRF